MPGSTDPINFVTGIQTGPENGPKYVRKDIDDWYREQVKSKSDDNGKDISRIQLTLFMEALAIIQARDVEDELSYFRLAGIHAAPWCPWGGVDPKAKKEEEKKKKGFCVHNDYTFPTWHRVYLALYEQVLHGAMEEFIAAKVPNSLKANWKAEADQWRLPYWDFARKVTLDNSTDPQSGASHQDTLRLPILCMMPSLMVQGFEGEDVRLRKMSNPLYKFETPQPMGQGDERYLIEGQVVNPSCKDDSKGFTYPWDKCVATTKYGVLDGFHEDVWANGGQNWLRANLALNEHINPGLVPDRTPVPTLQDMVFRLLSCGIDSWGAFASTRYVEKKEDDYYKQKQAKGKEENMGHGTAQEPQKDLVKEAKNATSVEFIHNNVHNFVGGSRFLRPDQANIHLWGAGHMSSVAVAAFDPIFWLHHCNIDRLTAIWQALNGSGKQYEEDASVKKKWFDDEHSKLVQNDELKPFKKADGTFYKSNDGTINAKVLELYGRHTRDLYNDVPDENNPKDKGDDKDDYIITVKYDRYAWQNGQPYVILVFLGHVDKKSHSGPNSPRFVGTVYNFSGSVEDCDNCLLQAQAGVKSIAQIPATIAARHFINEDKQHGEGEKDGAIPQPMYVVLNMLGQIITIDVRLELHKSNRSYYKHPVGSNPRDRLRYGHVKDGKQDPVASDAGGNQQPASAESSSIYPPA
ncbi:Di-copper centre-containing protein [Aspergillus phoenicis ATCC 13157]|uniref:tyrosinase n=1 Tax=Aspergillus phoenicis ATCC 13157 TaxID=1353007 RepID=A0A370PME4_ASPPH|nr:Di-copper centre-containing protein [Aspergillus phoenicis ATCC 13157]